MIFKNWKLEKKRMSSRVEISFVHAENTSVTSPATVPISICGKLELLHQVSFDSIKHRLEPQVTPALWKKERITLILLVITRS